MSYGGPRPVQSNWGASIRTVRASEPYGSHVSGRDLRDGVRLARDVYGRRDGTLNAGSRVRVIRPAGPSAHGAALARAARERAIAGTIGNVE